MSFENLLREVELFAKTNAHGLAGGAQLAESLVMASGDLKTRLGSVLGSAAGQRALFAALRAFAPNLVLDRNLITSYPSQGTVIVSRAADVREVLDRQDDFEVVYEPRMRKITGDANFFLGMQDGEEYQRNTSAMRLAARLEDIKDLVLPLARSEARRIMSAHPGAIDVPAMLTTVVPSRMVQDYFGVDTASVADLTEWSTAMFWYLFVDLRADPAVEKAALAAAAKCRAAIDAAIGKRENASGPVDIIRRCLALRDAGTKALEGHGIRDNLIGLVIGAIPTISKACVQLLDVLLDRKEALTAAQVAAARDDETEVGRIVFEALRFSPVNPFIYRRARRDCTIADGTMRECKIASGAMVLASNLSAMFDDACVTDPDKFRTDRPWSTYMLWGYGLHRCFGAAINQAVIPALMMPLLAGAPLRRAAGPSGHPDTETPFPRRFVVERG